MSNLSQSHLDWYNGAVRNLVKKVESGNIPVKDAIKIIEILTDILGDLTESTRG